MEAAAAGMIFSLFITFYNTGLVLPMQFLPASLKDSYQTENVKQKINKKPISPKDLFIFLYYGHYSNATRGRLKKEDSQPEYHIIEGDSPGGLNRSWARLIQRIYEVDPLLYPRCGKKMKIIAFIEDYKVVKKILDYLGIYEFERKRQPPKVAEETHGPREYIINDYIDCDHVC